MPTAGGLYFSEQGIEKPGQPAVILIHGAGVNHQVWPSELRRLPGWRVLAPDLPGHGQSTGPGSQSIQAGAASLTRFLDALELFRLVLIGHGMGGAIALTFIQHLPERAAALGLISTAARLRIPRRMLDLTSLQTGLPAAAQLLMELSSGPKMTRIQTVKYLRLLQATRPGVLRDDLLACDGFHQSLARSYFSTPAVIFAGAEDRLIPLADIRHLARHIPDCSLQVLPETGHLPMLEHPRLVAAGLAAFLAQKFPAEL